jgi:hypothetical protein
MAASRRFSSSAKALWVVAGVAAALLLAALGAEAFLRDGDEDERAEVASYIVGVNRIQGGLAGELSRINRAYASFRAASTQPTRQVAELRDAERTLGVVAQQIRALHVPDDAARLHKELLRLLALQSDFARELTQLAEYLPRLSDAQRELAPAGARVQWELAAARRRSTRLRSRSTGSPLRRCSSPRAAPRSPVFVTSRRSVRSCARRSTSSGRRRSDASRRTSRG